MVNDLRIAAQTALAFLNGQDQNGFGTQLMEYSRFYDVAHKIAKELEEALEGPTRVPFAEVYPKAYGWTLDQDGYLAGLVAGHMGYDITDMHIIDLMVEADLAEWKRFDETSVKEWPVHVATLDFVDAMAKSLGYTK